MRAGGGGDCEGFTGFTVLFFVQHSNKMANKKMFDIWPLAGDHQTTTNEVMYAKHKLVFQSGLLQLKWVLFSSAIVYIWWYSSVLLWGYLESLRQGEQQQDPQYKTKSSSVITDVTMIKSDTAWKAGTGVEVGKNGFQMKQGPWVG